MSEEIKALFDEQKKTFEQYNATVGKELKENKKLSTATKAVVAKMEEDFGKFETKIAEWQKEKDAAVEEKAAVQKKFDDIEAQMKRPASTDPAGFERKDFVSDKLYHEACDPKFQERKDAFWQYVRSPGLMTREQVKICQEQKVMTLGDPTTGGYLAPPDFVNDIIKEMREITPVLDIAKVYNTSASSIILPKKTGTITAVRRSESQAKSETTGLTYGSEQMTLPEMYGFVDVSEQNLEDSAFNLEAEVREELSDAFAALMGDEFINGVGPIEMEGLLTNASIGTKLSGAANILATGTFIEFCEATLKKQYHNNALLLFNLATLGKLRLLLQGDSSYAWVPGGFEGTPATICGKPYTLSEDCEDVGDGNYPIFIGDFKKGYTVGMRIGMSMKRISDTVTDAAGTVRFSARMRVGGSVVLPTAIKKYKSDDS